MYAIKIMSSENKADSDVGKGFKIILVDAGDTFEFGHDKDTGKPQVTVTGVREGEATYITYPVTGNCYVLSSTGKTIASFWGRSLWETPSMDTEPEIEVISGADEPCRQIKITLDPSDPHPERTIDTIQAMIANHARKAFPTGDNCAVMRKHWEEQGLSNVQIMLLQQERKPLCNNRADRDKAFRANVGTLVAIGIPVSIAMEESMYLLGGKDTSQE